MEAYRPVFRGNPKKRGLRGRNKIAQKEKEVKTHTLEVWRVKKNRDFGKGTAHVNHKEGSRKQDREAVKSPPIKDEHRKRSLSSKGEKKRCPPGGRRSKAGY